MSSSSKNDSPKSTLTEMQVGLLISVMNNLKAQPEVDWDDVASQAGFANKASAKKVFQRMRSKHGGGATVTTTTTTTAGAGGSPSSPSGAGAGVRGGPGTPTRVAKRDPAAHRVALKAARARTAASAARQAAREGDEGGQEQQQQQQEEEEEGEEGEREGGAEVNTGEV